jgi:acetyl esterase/lipase
MARERRSPIRRHYGNSPWQFGDFWLPRGGADPLVMLVHGGFWRAGKTLAMTEDLARALVDADMAVWNVEYAAGEVERGWQETVDDVVHALAFTARLCAEYSLDQSMIVVVGHSAGAHLSLAAVSARNRAVEDKHHDAVNVAAVVSLAGVTDLETAAQLGLGEDAVRRFLGAMPESDRATYAAASPLRRLPLGVPQLVIHGQLDLRVPASMSREYARAAAQAGDLVSLVELEDADHNALIQPATPAGQDVIALIGDVTRSDGSGRATASRWRTDPA